jgi:hypothetical protein
MPIGTTDLTNFLDSPPSIPISSFDSSMILNFHPTNLDLHHQHQTTLLVPSAQGDTVESTQLATTSCPQTGTQGGSLIARVLRPLPGSNTNGSRRMVTWSQREHE